MIEIEKFNRLGAHQAQNIMPVITRSRHKSGYFCPCPKKLENDTVCLKHKVETLKTLFKDIKMKKIIATNGNKVCNDVSGCTNRAVVAGRCGRHSGKFGCKFPGCKKMRQDKKFCKAHGGKHKNSKCKRPLCPKFSQGGGYCYTHGGGHRCKLGGCSGSANSSACKVCNVHIRLIPTTDLVAQLE